MSIIIEKSAIKEAVQEARAKGQKIGFVPTMGYLHEGHLSLIRQAKAENEIVIVSVFVNPTQFAPHEDFDQYPRDIDRDYKMAMEAGVDIVYHPKIEDIYMANATTFVEVEGDITQKLCGASRPSHFKGVTTIVNILFNIVTPDYAYFGQKDAQQVIIIQKMVRELHMNVQIVVCPIIREADGLAMSSRNIYLNNEERQQALILNQSLSEALALFYQGQTEVETLKQAILSKVQSQSLAKVDYVEILDAQTLNSIETIQKKALAAVAVKFGKTRLIDNIFIGNGV